MEKLLSIPDKTAINKPKEDPLKIVMLSSQSKVKFTNRQLFDTLIQDENGSKEVFETCQTGMCHIL